MAIGELAGNHFTTAHNGRKRLQNLAGNYVADAGEHLTLTWHGGGMLARWPSGLVTQIFRFCNGV